MRIEDVESIFQLETEVFPVLFNMTYRGIRFDRKKCEQLIDQLITREKATPHRTQKDLWKLC
jgi:hypothetical protein